MRSKCLLFLAILFFADFNALQAQHSVARDWNEVVLFGIRNDYARPTVHARNLFHTSTAMYDAWAVFDSIADPYFLGQTVDGFNCPFDGFTTTEDLDAARQEAMSYAILRVIVHRFQNSPEAFAIQNQAYGMMVDLGYQPYFLGTDYSTGDPAALGNYIGNCIIDFGMQDGANEANDYENLFYEPVNDPLVTEFPGNPDITDPNRWQPLTLDVFIDQAGNEIPFDTPDFLSPEWGTVSSFALDTLDRTIYERGGFDYEVYHDPGLPPLYDTSATATTMEEYIWGFSLVSVWSAHLDANDTTLWDISPASIGNVQSYPTDFADFPDFYNLVDGGDAGIGWDVNPATGQPYEEQLVKRADYARVLAEFWADGPDSETPPGHWFTILNYVNDHAQFEKRYRGQGEELDSLEWDVKAYFMLGGAMHDAAVTAWGVKGWYDYLRPISAIRYMAGLGQSTDTAMMSYHPGGIELIPGFIELVEMGDTLAGPGNENVGKIKLFAWKGPDYIAEPMTDEAGVDWILSENWWPYQRPSFVTPPFAGYVSGHSTYSRAAAEVMTMLTGDAYFPGGMGEFIAPMNEFLVFEDGPSETITLQWATYRDASDQCSLSRIWGGIHPPADDIPGRLMGIEIGVDAFHHAETYFFKDIDEDGFYNYVDCDDNDNTVYPGAPELCDGKDNDCNDLIDDGLTVYTYYIDLDNDGFGDVNFSQDTCQSFPITGYVDNAWDCNDQDSLINPSIMEICDGIDNDCDMFVDDSLTLYTYFLDADNDGYGDINMSKDTCQDTPIMGYVDNAWDCNDQDSLINPSIMEICDGIDNDCDMLVDDSLTLYTYFLDADNDGYGDINMPKDTCQDTPITGYVDNDWDCNDQDSLINPSIMEICDGIDNDCDLMVDDSLTIYTYYLDADSDGYGDANMPLDTCQDTPVMGYVDNDFDCNDADQLINPDAPEVCDGVDNDCNTMVDDGLEMFTYYLDEDEDTYGNPDSSIMTCWSTPIVGYVDDNTDCDDTDAAINPAADEIINNGIDEDCDGEDLMVGVYQPLVNNRIKIYPNPVESKLVIEMENQEEVRMSMFSPEGKSLVNGLRLDFENQQVHYELGHLQPGVYILIFRNSENHIISTKRIVKM